MSSGSLASGGTRLASSSDERLESLRLLYDELLRSLDLKLASVRSQQQRAATLAGVNGVLLALLVALHPGSPQWFPYVFLLAVGLLAVGLLFGALAISTGRVSIESPLSPPGKPAIKDVRSYVTQTPTALLEAWCGDLMAVLAGGELQSQESSRRKWMIWETVLVAFALVPIAVLAVVAVFAPAH